MGNSTVSQTEDLKSLLQFLDRDIQAYLQPFTSGNLDPPSLKCRSASNPSTPGVTEEQVAESKQSIIHACEKIVALLQGPTVWLTLEASGHLTSAAIAIALELRLPNIISSDANAPTGLNDLAKTTGASPDVLMRVLRYLTRRFIFEETRPLCYVNNTMSKALTTPFADAWIGLIATDYHRASSTLLDFLVEHKFEVPSEGQPSAFSKAFNTKYSMYDYHRLVDPKRGQYFAISQSAPSNGPHTLYPYAHMPAGSRMVDVGGGSGHITAPLAKQYPNIKFIIQDTPDTIAHGKSVYSEELPIEWQTTDFFNEQPVKGAEIYFLRHIMVDHPDRIALQILNCIANSMDENSRLLIADAIVPNGYGEDSDSLMNVLDLHQLCLFNSKERSLEQWRALLGSVERTLEIVKVWQSDPIGQEALLEIKLQEQPN